MNDAINTAILTLLLILGILGFAGIFGALFGMLNRERIPARGECPECGNTYSSECQRCVDNDIRCGLTEREMDEER